MFSKKNIVLLFILSFIVIFLFIGCTMLPPTPKTYTITSSATEGGSISPLGETTVTEGASQSFTITPNEGYEISDVLVDGESTGVLTAYTFTNIKANHTILAVFTQETQPSSPATPTVTQYTIIATAGPGGSTDPAGSVKVTNGKEKTFTITPDDCYQIKDVLVDNISVGDVGTYTLTNVKKNHNIEAIFTPRIYNANTNINYLTIQSAINDALTGETIFVCPGTYYENIIIDTKNITVRSINPSDPDIVANTIIDGRGFDSVVKIIGNSAPTLAGFTIQNGKSDFGGGIHISDNSFANILGNTITRNLIKSSFGIGGGIYINGSIPNIRSNTINYNDANTGGGIYLENNSHPDVKNNIIKHNEAIVGAGMFMYDGCIPDVQENQITDNIAETNGGGIYINSSSPLIIKENSINNNQVSIGGGGGIYIVNGSSPIIRENYIKNNIAEFYGGGIMIIDSCPNISQNEITGNSSTTKDGGGIYLDNYWVTNYFADESAAAINDNTINANSSSTSGGGISLLYSDITITGNKIQSNNTSGNGGGIFMKNSSPNITSDNNVSFNQAGEGGGISMSFSDPIIDGNTIYNNQAWNTYGGGLSVVASSPEIKNNQINSNWANQRGGAIYVANFSYPVVEDNTINNNTSFYAGGIWVSADSDLFPDDDRLTGWGSSIVVGSGYRDSIPINDISEPVEPVSGPAENTFSGNRQGVYLDYYTTGAHVYFAE
jgi:parallel beta-helix repeat protein